MYKFVMIVCDQFLFARTQLAYILKGVNYMKLKKVIAICASSAMTVASSVPAYAEEIHYNDSVSDDEIENEQKKDEEFDEEYGLEDSDNEPFIDNQDENEKGDDEKYCCNCGCCIKEEEPEEDDDGYICGECKVELTKEEMEKNAKELATMLSSFQELKNDSRFSNTFPSVREDMESGDIMVLSDAIYIYVILEDEIYTWYEVTSDGIKETPNLRFSNYASFYRVNKADAAFTIPDGLMAYQGDTSSSVSLPSGFIWQKPDKQLDELGNTEVLATYMPDNLLLYKPVYNIKINIQVKKLPMELTYPESRYTVVYTDDLTLSSILLPPGWSFENPDTTLDVGSKIYVAVFEEDEKYDYVTSTEPVKIRVDVDKSAYFINDIYIKVPAGTVLNNDVLPKINNGILEWDVAQKIATIPTVYTCHFIPDDLSRYRVTKDIPVHIEVETLSAEETDKPQPSVSTLPPMSVPETTSSPAPSEMPFVTPTPGNNNENAVSTSSPSDSVTPGPSVSQDSNTNATETSKPDGVQNITQVLPNNTPDINVKPDVMPTSVPDNKYQQIDFGGTLNISSIKGNSALKPNVTPAPSASKRPGISASASESNVSVNDKNNSVIKVPDSTEKPSNKKNTAKPASTPKASGNSLSVTGVKKNNNSSGTKNTVTVTSKNTAKTSSFNSKNDVSYNTIAVNKSNKKVLPISLTSSSDKQTSYPATINVSSSSLTPKSFTVRKSSSHSSGTNIKKNNASPSNIISVSSGTSAHTSFGSSNSEIVSSTTSFSDNETNESLSSFSLGMSDDDRITSTRDTISSAGQETDGMDNPNTPSSITLLADGEVPRMNVPDNYGDMPQDEILDNEDDEEIQDEENEKEEKDNQNKEEESGMSTATIAAIVIGLLVLVGVIIYFIKHH